MRGAHLLGGVYVVEGAHALEDGGFVAGYGLAAAVDAAAGAGHDLYEVEVFAAAADLFEEFAGVAEAADGGDAYFQGADL